MSAEQFTAVMPYISSDLVSMIVERCSSSEKEAIQRLYSSKLYSLLEQEETKLWQYSTPMLFLLLEQEEKTGRIEFPDT